MSELESTTFDGAATYRDIVQLLDDLSALQGELLDYLAAKHELLARGRFDELTTLAPRESAIVKHFSTLQQRREAIFSGASLSTRQGANLRALVRTMPTVPREALEGRITQVSQKARLAQQKLLAQWVVMQRSLFHLSQLLEIIATGGRPRPTYGKGETTSTGGSLVDQAI